MASRRFFGNISKKFIILWLVVFLFLLFVLCGLGLAPKGLLEIGERIRFSGENGDSSVVPASSASSGNIGQTISSWESRIVIDDINLNAPVMEPQNSDVGVLNAALEKGAVRYPGSGQPGEVGNVLIFGHSAGTAIISNGNYAIFNRLKDLKPGALIRIQSGGYDYWYIVKAVSIRKASETWVELSTPKKLLTLSTCRVYGAKEDRYVVEAEFFAGMRSSLQ